MRFLALFSVLILAGCSTIQKPHYYRVENHEGVKGYLLGTLHIGVPLGDLPSSIKDQFEKSNPVFVEADLTTGSVLAEENARFSGPLKKDLKKSPIFAQVEQLMYVESLGIKGLDTEVNSPAMQNLKKSYIQILEDLRKAENGIDPASLKPAAFANGESLKSRLTTPQWKAVVQILTPIFEREEIIEKLHIETVLLYVKNNRKSEILVTRAKATRLDPKWSLDLNLTQLAKEKQKNLRTLDSESSVSPACYAEMYLSDIQDLLMKSGEQLFSEFDHLDEVYRRGDLNELTQLVSSKSSPQIQKCLLTKRNHEWIPQIEEQLKNSRQTVPFFAFGAGHLGGSEGIIHLLQLRGYKVERVQ